MKNHESFSYSPEQRNGTIADSINNLDIKNLTEQDKEFLVSTAQAYIYETFKSQICPESHPHISEENRQRLEELPSRIQFLNHKEMRDINKNSGTVRGKVIGGYDNLTRRIVIDIEKIKSPEDLMKTIIHESCHFISDPGLNAPLLSKGHKFRQIQRNDSLKGEYSILTRMLDEGATQKITNKVLAIMGFNSESKTYKKQVSFIDQLSNFIDGSRNQDTVTEAYFQGYPDLIRQRFEKAYDTKIYGEPRGDDEFYAENSTGEFVNLLNDFSSSIYYEHETLRLKTAQSHKSRVKSILG